MPILVLKTSGWGVKLKVGGVIINMIPGDYFVNGEIIHTCNFCGREYNHNEYVQTMSEQAPNRIKSGFKSVGSRYCGLYCGWLNDVDFCRTSLTRERVEEMKEDVAKRVAKYLKSKKKS